MKKIQLFIRKLLKSQFFLNHPIAFFIVPSLLSFFIVINFIFNSINSHFLEWVVAIIWITWWLLLNFLAIILTSNSTVLSAMKDDYNKNNIYGTINIGVKSIPNNKNINLYELIYYRIFFLIFLSILFIMLYVSSFAWFINLVVFIDWIFHPGSFGIIKAFSLFFYIYLLILYFILLSHLIYKLYYLFHSPSTID